MHVKTRLCFVCRRTNFYFTTVEVYHVGLMFQIRGQRTHDVMSTLQHDATTRSFCWKHGLSCLVKRQVAAISRLFLVYGKNIWGGTSDRIVQKMQYTTVYSHTALTVISHYLMECRMTCCVFDVTALRPAGGCFCNVGVSKNSGYLIWGPYNRDPTI